MAQPYGGRNDYRNGGGYRGDRQNTPAAPAPDFPEDYVDFAENLMRRQSRSITTSKLRKILSLLMDIYNTEVIRTEEMVSEESAMKLQLARIRIAYESGRDESVMEFVNQAHLLPWLKDIGNSRERAIRYIHYLEALVAYHRFFGGKEN